MDPGAAGADGDLDLDLDLDLGSAPGSGASGDPAAAAWEAAPDAGAGAADPGAGSPLAFGDDDPFATLDAGAELAGDPDPGTGFDAGGMAGFDLGGPPEASFSGGAGASEVEAAPRPPPRAPAPAPRAVRAPEAAPETPSATPPRRRGLGAVVAINALFGLALVALLLGAFVASRTGGRFTLSVFSPARLRAAFTGASAPGLTVTRFTNGLYPTRTGGQVLVVRGVAANNGDRAAHPGPVEVRLLGPGGKVVAKARGVLGVLPSAAEVWRLDDDDAARALLEALGRRAPETVKAHARVPFFAVIPTWRGDLRQMRFQVEVGGAS